MSGAGGGHDALAALSAVEKGELLDALLVANPAWQASAEAAAGDRLAHADRHGVATQLQQQLCGLDHELIGDRAGYHPGEGYVEPTQAALDLLGEQVDPYLQDMTRRVRLGLTAAAAQLGAGVLLGLYACRDFQADHSVLAWAEDFPLDHAHWVAQQMRDAALLTPTLTDELANLIPEWTPSILNQTGHR